jgi:hypothetical protein
MIVAGLAMKGPPLTWWLKWYPHHRSMNWDAFTYVFLWQFKPEWRVILPLSDDEEDMEFEPEQLTGSIVEQSMVVEEGINDFNQQSSSLEVADLEIADSIEDSLVQSQFPTKGDNKIQSCEFVTEGIDTAPAVADKQICTDQDLRLYFDFNFLVCDLVHSPCFTLARFTPTFSAPSMKSTMNTTSTTSPQHLVILFDPGRYFNLPKSWSTNHALPLPSPEPPDRVVVLLSWLSALSYLYDPGPTYSTLLTKVSYHHYSFQFERTRITGNPFQFISIRDVNGYPWTWIL